MDRQQPGLRSKWIGTACSHQIVAGPDTVQRLTRHIKGNRVRRRHTPAPENHLPAVVFSSMPVYGVSIFHDELKNCALARSILIFLMGSEAAILSLHLYCYLVDFRMFDEFVKGMAFNGFSVHAEKSLAENALPKLFVPRLVKGQPGNLPRPAHALYLFKYGEPCYSILWIQPCRMASSDVVILAYM
jgi:hypothetical protein